MIEDLYTSSFLLDGSPYDLVMMDIVWLPKFAMGKQPYLVLKNGYLLTRRVLYNDPQLVKEYPYFPDMLNASCR